MKKSEKKISNITELKNGDVVLVDNPLFGETVAVVGFKMKILKYSIFDGDGKNPQRSLGRQDDGTLKFVYAKDVGDTGDEKITEISLMNEDKGTYTFNELDDISTWNIRKISKKHPKYDASGVLTSKIVSGVVSLFRD